MSQFRKKVLLSLQQYGNIFFAKKMVAYCQRENNKGTHNLRTWGNVKLASENINYKDATANYEGNNNEIIILCGGGGGSK